MAEPFETIKAKLSKTKLWLKLLAEPNRNHYGVKLSGSRDAFYLGNDEEHITILQNTNGMHHTGSHLGYKQKHTSLTTLDSILDHIDHNKNFYKNKHIRIAVEYINDMK